MATTIRTKIMTATVAAAVALTGFAPAANAGILDVISNGLSISAGGQAEYDTTAPATTRKTTTRKTTTGDNNTPMAADYRADRAEKSDADMLGKDFNKSQDVWTNKLYRAKAIELATLVNRHRAHQGQGAMRLDPTMSEAAQTWAEHMAEYHWFDHDPASKKMGEIIAMRYNINNPDTAERFIWQWENSPEHNKLLHQDNFRAMGVGIAADDETGEVYAVVRLYYH